MRAVRPLAGRPRFITRAANIPPPMGRVQRRGDAGLESRITSRKDRATRSSTRGLRRRAAGGEVELAQRLPWGEVHLAIVRVVARDATAADEVRRVVGYHVHPLREPPSRTRWSVARARLGSGRSGTTLVTPTRLDRTNP